MSLRHNISSLWLKEGNFEYAPKLRKSTQGHQPDVYFHSD